MSNDEPLSKFLRGKYQALGLGSLPQVDVEDALSFVLSREALVPFWPELPQRNENESIEKRSLRVCEENWVGYDPLAASCFHAVKPYLKSHHIKPGVFKTQTLGPFSRAHLLQHQLGHRYASFSRALDAAISQTIKELDFQFRHLKGTSDCLLLVIDEPSFHFWTGTSEEHREAARDAWSYLYVRAAEYGVFLGMHCCGDFHLDLLSLPLDLLSFDLLNSKNKEDCLSSARWTDAVSRGMVLVPGVFPALLEPAQGTSKVLKRGVDELVNFLRHIGLYDRFSLSQNSGERNPLLWDVELPAGILWSATCGHANADPDWLEMLYPKAPQEYQWTYN